MKLITLLCLFLLSFIECMQKFISKKGVCIGTAGKICNQTDRRVCMRINNSATIFANQCQACQINGIGIKTATPMSDYVYCNTNETNEQCCSAI